jgi:hypothetical protein
MIIEFLPKGVETVNHDDRDSQLHLFVVHPKTLYNMINGFLAFDWVADRERPENFNKVE